MDVNWLAEPQKLRPLMVWEMEVKLQEKGPSDRLLWRTGRHGAGRWFQALFTEGLPVACQKLVGPGARTK